MIRPSIVSNLIRKLHSRVALSMFSAFVVSTNLIGATFTVTNNTWANTAGSLLWCVNQANAVAGPHTINFTNNGAAYVIQANSQITLNNQVTIDGSTSGFVVELNGTTALNTNGILISSTAAGTIIRGLFITQYDYNAIHVLASNVQIGGDRSLNYGNILSGNGQAGLRIENAANTLVQGNRIGLNAAGDAALTNGFDGINIFGTSSASIIGGNNANLRNVISSNGFNGINIESGAHTIIGNYIGTNALGTAALGNNQQGIRLVSTANGTIIGGNTAGQRNLVSGNKNNGIYALAGAHTITGNYVGTNAAATAAIPNLENGINIEATSTGNVIGGATTSLRNVVSGNNYNGVNIFSGANTVSGNYIGTTATGDAALGNGRDGIRIAGTSTGNTIGGSTTDSKNVISSNGYNGIEIENGAHTVSGNYIGTNALGSAALGNAQDGVRIAIASNNNVIGAGNVISGNLLNGIRVLTGTHTIKGNYIGTDASGTTAVANLLNGINLIAAGDGNTIGGLTVADRNVISGNKETGLRSDHTKLLKVYGNIIGLDASGLNDLGNGIDGIYCRDFADNHEIGGATAAHRNIVSGNGRDGIFYEFDITGLKISGNYIGTNINGKGGVGNLGNNRNGISFNNRTTGTIISGNVSSGNGLNFKKGQDNGVGVFGYESTGYTITNNIIGLEADGLVALGNYENGISLIVSGTGTISQNTVSSNGSWHTAATATAASPQAGKLPFGHGIVLNSSSNISVLGNKVGVNINGEGNFGNLQSGVIFIFGDNFTVGTSAAADRNIIGNNVEFGVHFVQVGSNVSVKNNLIGQSPTGLNIGNNSGGIFIDGPVNSSNLKIGGSLANESNVIANSTGTFQRFASACGVCVSGNGNVSGIKNLVFNNSITCNQGLGIDLNLLGNMYDRWSTQYWPSPSVAPVTGFGNNKKSAPVVNPSNSKSKVSGTGVVGEVIHVYDNVCDCEGEKYLASTTVAANGKWEVNLSSPVIDNAHVTAIAIDANSNTSQFSGCCRVKSDSIKVDKAILCLGDSSFIQLTDHVGSSFQLQSSSSASGPWANVGVAKTTRLDSTWKIIPTVVGTVFYRVYSEASSWGSATGTSTICNTSSKVISITTNPSVSMTIGSIVQATCGLNNASFKINVVGGTAPISYSIDDSLSFSANNTYNNLAPNTYKIVLKDSKACSDRTSVVLNSSESPVIDSVKFTNPINCKDNNGSITIYAKGASGVLEYSVNNGATYQSSNQFTTVGAANSPYKIKVRYVGNQCVVSHTSDIVLTPKNISLSLNATTFLCESDTLKITPTILGANGKTTMNWNSGASSAAVFKLSPVTAGRYTAEVTDSIGCKNTAFIDVTVEKSPTKANAGIDKTICTDTVYLNATAPSVGTGSWKDIGANGSVKVIADPKSYAFGYTTGEIKLEWTVVNGICPAFKDTVVFTRTTNLTAADAGEKQVICATSTNLNASIPIKGTATWSQKGSANINEVLNPKTLVSNLQIGDNYFYWTTFDGVCKDVYDSVLVVRDFVTASEVPTLSSDKLFVPAGETVIITQSSTEKNIRWYSSTDKVNWTLLADVDNSISANPSVPTYFTSVVDIKSCADIKGDTILIGISDPSNPPVANPDSISIFEDEVSVESFVSLLNNDVKVDGTKEVVKVNGQSTKTVNGKYGTLTWNQNGTFTYVLNNELAVVQSLNVGQVLVDTFTYQITDGNNGFASSILKVKILGVNDAPKFDADTIYRTINENTILTIDLVATDIDDTDLTYAITDAPKHGTSTVDPKTGKLIYTPIKDYVGQDTLYAQVCDPANLCDQIMIVITVLNVNQAPVAVKDENNRTDFQTSIVISVLTNDFDPDGNQDINPTSVVITKQPSHGTVTVDPKTGEVTYVPNDGYFGDDSFEYKFSDFSGAESNSAIVLITINQRPPFKVFEAVTPNDDGKNDFMRIENIEYYPNTTVKIFNRWGNLVWELPTKCNGYQNNDSECRFGGNSNVGLGSGGELPDGSYYYVVDGSADGVNPCQGYLIKN